MSNFTDFFPAAGGGGGIGQTITVGDYAYPNSRNVTEWIGTRNAVNSSDSRSMSIALYGGSNNPFGYQASLGTVADTYVTIADVTGASNGGALTFIAAHASQIFQSWPNVYTTRLTLDGGTPIEFTSTATTGSSEGHAFFVGAYLPVTGGMSNGGMSGVGSYNYGAGTASIRSNYNTTDGCFSGNSGTATSAGQQGILVTGLDPMDALYRGAPFVHFTSSCKVEIKVSSVAQGTNRTGYAAILTF
jgi:hypothetical protein|tara:strand:- start:241 stop:975 length:735 start_codon:yes stop_codon:yes gene_type:complete